MFPRWMGTLVTAVVAITVVGIAAWMLGVKAHIWPSASGGFWVF